MSLYEKCEVNSFASFRNSNKYNVHVQSVVGSPNGKQTLNAGIRSITSPRPYYLYTRNRPFLPLVSLPTHTQTAVASTSTFNHSCTQEHHAQTTFAPISGISPYKCQQSHIPNTSNSKNFYQQRHTRMQLSEQTTYTKACTVISRDRLIL